MGKKLFTQKNVAKNVNTWGKNILSWWLSLSILLAGTGYTQYEYFCSMAQQAWASVDEPKTCCTQADCCGVSVEFKKQDILKHQQVQDFAFAAFLLPEKIFQFHFLAYVLDLAESVSPVFFTDSSPPLSGREICVLKCSFLI